MCSPHCSLDVKHQSINHVNFLNMTEFNLCTCKRIVKNVNFMYMYYSIYMRLENLNILYLNYTCSCTIYSFKDKDAIIPTQ